MNCNGCGAEIELRSGDRVGFRDSCSKCGSDLHSCVHCGFHDVSAYNECRESNAERVSDRDRANRCDYFAPGGQAGDQLESRRSSALSGLDDLFKK